jgi:hypothetical protein
MRFSAGALALLLTAGWLAPGQVSTKGGVPARKKTVPASADPVTDPPPPAKASLPPASERLTYGVEWRLIHAGDVTIESQGSRAEMTIDSAGLVSSLFKVHDTYEVNFDEPLCATSSRMDAEEGKRHREAKVTYDRSRNHATFLERDVLKNVVVHMNEVDIPNCVHEVITAFLRLRSMNVEPGQSAQLPMSDGRRSAAVKLEAQEREEVKTPAGAYQTIRYEAYMMNGVVYARKGRVWIWLSDQGRRLPVQIRLRLPFPIGTVTLQLQKEEHS